MSLLHFPFDPPPRLLEQYNQIMENERALTSKEYLIPDASRIYDNLVQIIEVAKQSTISRSFNVRYNVTKERSALESVSAHTNLMQEILDKSLTYIYGPFFGEPGSEYPLTADHFSYREIVHACKQHDLPENTIGDIPDNGDRNDEVKAAVEKDYWVEYNSHYRESERLFARSVCKLLANMRDKQGETGRLLYAADKTSALIIVLTYDLLGLNPKMHFTDVLASERDIIEMHFCDYCQEGYYRASEMWTIDFLRLRKINQYDDSGYFTALIVMLTLLVNGRWYNWREHDYEESQNYNN